MKQPTRENLGTIRIVYCAPYSLQLYGIPYEIRSRPIASAPRHLWEAAQTRFDRPFYGPNGPVYRPDPLADWIPLADSDPLVRVWLARLKERDGLPGYPHEWIALAELLPGPDDTGPASGSLHTSDANPWGMRDTCDEDYL